MYVIRRTPHPLYGNTYELQTFKCRTCGDEIERSADQSGLPHVNDAVVLKAASDSGRLFEMARDELQHSWLLRLLAEEEAKDSKSMDK